MSASNFKKFSDDFIRDVGLHPDNEPSMYIQYVIARNTEQTSDECGNISFVEDGVNAVVKKMDEIIKLLKDSQ